MLPTQPSKFPALLPPATATPGAPKPAAPASTPDVARGRVSADPALPSCPVSVGRLSTATLQAVVSQPAAAAPENSAQTTPAKDFTAVVQRRPAMPVLPTGPGPTFLSPLRPLPTIAVGPAASVVTPGSAPKPQAALQASVPCASGPVAVKLPGVAAKAEIGKGGQVVTASTTGHRTPAARVPAPTDAASDTIPLLAGTAMPTAAAPLVNTPAKRLIRLIPAHTTRHDVRILLHGQTFTNVRTTRGEPPTQDRLTGLQAKQWSTLLEKHYGVNLYTKDGRVDNYSTPWSHYVDEARATGRGLTEEEHKFDCSKDTTDKKSSINHILPIAMAQHVVSEVTGKYISAQRQSEVLDCARCHASTAFRVARPPQAAQSGAPYADPFSYSLGQIAAQQAAAVGMIHGYSVAIIEEDRRQEPLRKNDAYAECPHASEVREEGRLAKKRRQALKLTFSMLGNDALEQTLSTVLRGVRDDLRAEDTPMAVRLVLADYHLKAMAQGNRYLRNIAFPLKNDFYQNCALIVSAIMRQYQGRRPNEHTVMLRLLQKLHDSLVSPGCSVKAVLDGIDDIHRIALTEIHQSHYNTLMKLTFNSAGNLRIGNKSLNQTIGSACDLPLNRDGKTPTPRGLRLWQAHYNYAPHRYLEDGVLDRRGFTREGWGPDAPAWSSSKQHS